MRSIVDVGLLTGSPSRRPKSAITSLRRSSNGSPRCGQSSGDAAERRLIMEDPLIRAATADDVPAIADIVNQGYRRYVDRMGKPPGPMLDDYAARVSEGAASVLEEGAALAGIIVLLPRTSHLLLDNVRRLTRSPRFAVGPAAA